MVELTGVVKHSTAHYGSEHYDSVSNFGESHYWQAGDVAMWNDSDGVFHTAFYTGETSNLWAHRDKLVDIAERLLIVKYSKDNARILGSHIKGIDLDWRKPTLKQEPLLDQTIVPILGLF